MIVFKECGLVSLTIILAAAMLPLELHAQQIPIRGPIPFDVYDQDGNGSISENEFNTVRTERIKQRADANRPMRGIANAPSFVDFDTDGNGQLSKDELRAGQQMQQQQRRGMGKGQQRGMNQRGGMGKGLNAGKNRPVFSDYDLDGDGKILEKEFAEARKRRIEQRAQQGYRMKNLGNMPGFTDIDSNADNAISAEEFATYQAQRRKRN